MDVICIVAGTLLIIFGANRKDDLGQRTGGGIALLTSGIVVTSIGVIIFTVAFMVAYFMTQAGIWK